MNFENKFLATFVVAGTGEDIAFFTCAYLWTHCIYYALFRKRFQGKVVMPTVTQSISVVCSCQYLSNNNGMRLGAGQLGREYYI